MHYYYVHYCITYNDNTFYGDTYISENLEQVKDHFKDYFDTMNYKVKKFKNLYHDYYIEIGTFYTKGKPYEYFNDMSMTLFHKIINIDDILTNKIDINVVDCLDNK